MRDNITGQGGGITEQSFENTFPKREEKYHGICQEEYWKILPGRVLENTAWKSICGILCVRKLRRLALVETDQSSFDGQLQIAAG